MLIKSVNDAHTSRTLHTSTVSHQFKSLKKSQIIWQNIMSLFSCNCKFVKSLSTIQAYRKEMSTPSMLSPIFTLGPPACPDTRTTSTARNHAMVEHGETTIQGSPPRGCWSDEMWQFNIKREVTNFQIGGVSARGNTSSKISWNKFNKLRLFEAQVHCRCWCQWNVSRSFVSVFQNTLESVGVSGLWTFNKNIGPNFDLHLSAFTPP